MPFFYADSLRFPLSPASSQFHASRRALLTGATGGFASIAAAALLHADEDHADTGNQPTTGAAASEQSHDQIATTHHQPRVRRVIQLFMTGGVSPMDTFDYKPALERLHGQNLGPDEKPEGFTAPAGAVMKSPFQFARYGETGRWVSSLFPHFSQVIDQPAFLMAMSAATNVHGPATYLMNTGFMTPGFPCFGAWISYALGQLSEELPTFVVLPDPRGLPYNQRGNFSAGFLPSRYQGTVLNGTDMSALPDLFPDPTFEFATGAADLETRRLLRIINERHAATRVQDTQLEARIAAAELAAAMQLAAPEAFDLTQESDVTHAAYGTDIEETQDFARRCLLARRLLERGTRFVQVWSGPQGATNNWDNHGSIPRELPPMARSIDQPMTALLNDLGQRGLLEDTLLIWSTEFGRTPFAQGGEGRDHNGGTFVTWLAGAGVKPGVTYGESDELGYQTATGETKCYDLHATVLHLLGFDHTRLTVRAGGIDRRLTDVHGRVIHEILNA